MKRQQAQLDRVSRVLSVAEAGCVMSDSPCPSPTPPSAAPTSMVPSSGPSTSQHDLATSSASALLPAQMPLPSPVDQKLPSLAQAPKPPPPPLAESKCSLHEQLQELVSTSEAPHRLPSRLFPRLHSHVGPEGAVLQPPADPSFPASTSPYQPQLQQQQAPPPLQGYEPEMMGENDSGMLSLMMPCWPEYMPP